MDRLAFATDEHVPRAYVTALQSNGFDVVPVTDEHGERTVDEHLLDWAGSVDRVLLTNDRDFVAFEADHDHAGLVVYTDQVRPPSAFVRAIRRVDRQFSPAEIRNVVVWLDSWC